MRSTIFTPSRGVAMAMDHAHKRTELPGWFPYAVVASLVVAVGAGIRSGWKLSGDQPAPQPTGPKQAGVINGVGDWTSGEFRI